MLGDGLARDSALFLTAMMLLSIAWMAPVATARQTLLIASFSLELLFLCPLGKLVKARVLALRLLLLHVLVRRESNPEVLPPLQRVLEAQSLPPAQLAIEIALIELSLSSRCCLRIFSRSCCSFSCRDIVVTLLLDCAGCCLHYCGSSSSGGFRLLDFEGGRAD